MPVDVAPSARQQLAAMGAELKSLARASAGGLSEAEEAALKTRTRVLIGEYQRATANAKAPAVCEFVDTLLEGDVRTICWGFADGFWGVLLGDGEVCGVLPGARGSPA